MTRHDPPEELVVLGADTPVGRALVDLLSHHESSPRVTGLPARHGPGRDDLAHAFEGAAAVVDIADAVGTPAGAGIRDSVTKATRSVVGAAESAGVRHLVFVSSAGLGRPSESEHFTARVAAERLVEKSEVPHTVVRTTQLFESVRHLSRSRPRGDLRLARLLIQPIAARDVAEAVAQLVMDRARGDIVALAGPDRFRLDDLVMRDRLVRFFHRDAWAAQPTTRTASQFDGISLLPAGKAETTRTRFADWAADMANPRSTLVGGGS